MPTRGENGEGSGCRPPSFRVVVPIQPATEYRVPSIIGLACGFSSFPNAGQGEQQATPIICIGHTNNLHFYVFALLTHKEQSTIDPLDLSQWRFYVLATSTLEARTRSQHSITLKSLEGLCGAVEYHALGELVQSAAKLNECVPLKCSAMAKLQSCGN